MIFKRFFKPKWQHADAAVRQQAISTLEPTDPAHKAVLHELAFNDGAEAVRKAALSKLNDFCLWWQASKHDSAERLQQLAEQTLINLLLQNQVEPKLKQQFITECKRSSILEQLAQTETDAELKFALLTRLNKDELNQKALFDPVLSISQKHQLLAQIHDEKTLEKLAQKLDGELLTEVQQKLQQLSDDRLKPQLIRKQVTLLLAKLNAVRDRHPLEEVPGQLALLQQEWQQLSADLACLADEADGFRQKYHKLVAQLSAWLAPRLAELEQVHAEKTQAQQREQNSRDVAQQLTAIEQAMQQALLSADISAAQQLEAQLQVVQQIIDTTELNNATLLSEQLGKLKQTLSALPILAEQLASLTRIVADWAALALPQQAEDYPQFETQLAGFKAQWRDITKAMMLPVPPSLAEARNALNTQWRELERAYTTQASKLQMQCRNKLQQFRQRYQSGNYNVLFGLFKGIEQDYQQLSPASQQALAKDYSFACDKHAEIADWQQYIATPRKQALLAEIQQLPSVIDAQQLHQRADAVKQARKQWNSLGRAEADLEDALNAAFDLACEQAFAPCRELFAQQDAERAKNAQTRQQLIAQLEAQHQSYLQTGWPDSKTLDQQVQHFKQLWQQAGAVDKQQYAQLQQRFAEAIQPLQAQLKQLRTEIFNAKQQLIEQAQAALQLADANMSSKVLKDCQKQWKKLGVGARKQDQAQWQQFRALCDGFFHARAQQAVQSRHAEQAEFTQVQQQVQSIEEQLDAAANAATFSTLTQQLNAIDAHSQGAVQLVRKAQEQLTKAQRQWQLNQQQQELHTMFDVLAQPDISASELPLAFRDSFAAQQEQQFSRRQLTVALEIVAGVAATAGTQEERQQVQLMLLSDKHNQGNVLDKDTLLKRWLQFGALSADEQPLLQRVKTVFS